MIDRYELSTIDLDLEGDALATALANQRRAQAIAALQEKQRLPARRLADPAGDPDRD